MGSDPTVFERGLDHLHGGEVDQAERLFRGLLNADLGDARAWFGLGCVHALRGRKNEAVAEWLRSVEIDPGYAEAHYALAWAYYDVGDRQKGHEHAMKALRSRVPFDSVRELLDRFPRTGQSVKVHRKTERPSPVETAKKIEPIVLDIPKEKRGEPERVQTARPDRDIHAESPRPAAPRKRSKMFIVWITIGIIIGAAIGTYGIPRSNVAELNSQIDDLQGKISDYEVQVEQLKQEITQLNEQLSVKTSDLSKLNSKYNNLKDDYTALQEEYTSAKANLQELEQTIQDLQGHILDLQRTFNYTPGEWNELKTWAGSAPMTTELFYIPSDQIRISWNLDLTLYSVFSIYLYQEGSESYTDVWAFLEDQPEGETYAYITPGYYYLDFSVANCEYRVKLEALIS